MATAWTPLANLTLGSSASSVTFSSISGSYRDLVLVMNPSGTGAINVTLQMNSDTGANYYSVILAGNGTSASSATESTTAITLDYTAYLSSGISALVANVMDYSATDKHKLVLGRANNSNTGTNIIAGRWANTAAVTTLKLNASGGFNFATGSTFALYGVSA